MSPPIDPLDTELSTKSRDWLAEEEKRLVRRLQAVRSYLNHFSPIQRLPEDILIRIFILCVPYWAPNKGIDTDRVRITHVCRGWRTIALCSPLLWSTIFPAPLPAWRTYLERSGNAPLTLRWRPMDPNLGFCTPFLSPWFEIGECSDRYVGVDLELDPQKTDDCITSFYEWDNLESFTLRVCKNFSPNSRWPHHTKILPSSVTEALFDAPRLQHLRLKNVVPYSVPFLNIQPSLPRGLRTLHLVFQGRGNMMKPSMTPTLEWHLSLLRCCPALEELVLSVPYPRGVRREQGIGRLQRVELGCLRNLNLASREKSGVSELLGYLVVPADAQIRLYTSESIEPSIGQLPRDDGSRGIMPRPDLKRVQLNLNDWRMVLKGFRNQQEDSPDIPHLIVSSHETRFISLGSWAPMLIQIQAVFKDTLTSLSVLVGGLNSKNESIEGWREALSICASLEAITVTNDRAMQIRIPWHKTPMVLPALTADPLSPDPPLVPRLASLHLMGFKRRPEMCEEVRNVVASRQGKAVPLQVWMDSTLWTLSRSQIRRQNRAR